MKKIGIILGIVLVVAVIVVFVITGNESEEFNITNAIQVLDSKLPELTEVDADNLQNAYGLDLSKIESYVVKRNEHGDLYAIFKTEHTIEVDEDMQDYFEKLKKFDASYSPERLQILSDRVEKKIDNVLIYIIAENAEELYNEIIQGM